MFLDGLAPIKHTHIHTHLSPHSGVICVYSSSVHTRALSIEACDVRLIEWPVPPSACYCERSRMRVTRPVHGAQGGPAAQYGSAMDDPLNPSSFPLYFPGAVRIAAYLVSLSSGGLPRAVRPTSVKIDYTCVRAAVVYCTFFPTLAFHSRFIHFPISYILLKRYFNGSSHGFFSRLASKLYYL